MARRPTVKPPTRFTETKRAEFLLQLTRLGSYRAAAAAIGVHAITVMRYRQGHPDYQEQCQSAKDGLLKELVGTARRLAIEGVEEMVFGKDGKQLRDANGQPVVRRKYSERVLLRWLARLDPDNWSDTVKVDQTVRGKVEHVPGSFHPKDLSPRRRAAMREMLRRDNDDPSRN